MIPDLDRIQHATPSPAMLPQKQTDPEMLFQDVKAIIESGVAEAAVAVHRTAVVTFWRVGKRVVEEIKGGERAAYGSETVKNLAERLVPVYGVSYSKRNLDYYCRFFRLFPDFEIVNARVHNLNWTHYRQLLGVESEDARYWYVREASRENWSARTLARNVGSQYYHRLLQAPKKDSVLEEMKSLTTGGAPPVEEMVKSPVIAEFFHLAPNTDFTESDLEKAILDHITRFLMELGRGFSFVARQQHVVADAEDYFVDLVFYNYVLKCFFLVDLKTAKLTHRDVGQMDMYVRMFDELKRTEGDNPTVGLLLCAETGADIARYSVLNGSKQLFAAKYLTYLPSEEELRREIERQKEIFAIQHPSS